MREIWEGFSFDIQRHAGDISIPSKTFGAYYYPLQESSGVFSFASKTYTETIPSTGSYDYYLKIQQKAGASSGGATIGTLAEVSIVDKDGNATSGRTLSSLNLGSWRALLLGGSAYRPSLSFSGINVDKVTVEISSSVNPVVGIGGTTYSLDSYSLAGQKFTSVADKTANITFRISNGSFVDGSAELTAGSLILDSTTAAPALSVGSISPTSVTVSNGTVVTAITNGTHESQVYVTSDGVVSGLESEDKFSIGDTTYEASTKDNRTWLTETAGGATAYYLEDIGKDITSATVTASPSGTHKVSGMSPVADQNADLTLSDATAASSVYGGAGNSSVYVYRKNGAIGQSGTSSSDNGTFLGTLAYDSSADRFTYDASNSSQSQAITPAATASTKNWVLIGSSSKDTIETTNTTAPTIDGGAGNDSIVADVNSASISGGTGNDTINATVAGGSAISELSIDGGDGKDSIVADAGVRYSTILGGAGEDTLTSHDATNTVTGGAGEDIFDISSSTAAVNISDYNFSEDDIWLNSAAVTSAVDTLVTTSGALSVDGVIDATALSRGKATVTGEGYYAVNLRDANRRKQLLGWVGENGTLINATSLSKSVVLTGRTNSEGDSLYGGSGKDTIYAGADDSVWGAAGNDSIVVGGNTGVVVGVNSAGGKDTVTGFVTGFEEGSRLYLVDVNASNATLSADSGKNLILKAGASSTTLASGSNTSISATGAYEVLLGSTKAAVAASNTTIKASGVDYADMYFGTKNGTVRSGLNFATVSDDVSIDLSDTAKYRNIGYVMGGTADNTLIGSSAKETLEAAAGANTSLYGGAGADLLIGGTGNDDFFFTTGAGKDTVQMFTAGVEDTSDKLTIFDANIGTSNVRRTSDTSFRVALNNSDALTVNVSGGKVDEKIRINDRNSDYVVKVGLNTTGSSLTYEGDANVYIGGSKSDTLTIGDSENHNIWLDGSRGTFFDSMEVIDAVNSSGNDTLAGSNTSDTIRAGKGNSSLWGGAGRMSDSLVGGSGADMFFWGYGEGNDTIVGGEGDIVNLYSLQLSQLTDWSYTNSSLSLTFGNQKLTVNGQVNDYAIEGTTFTLDRSTGSWSAKK